MKKNLMFLLFIWAFKLAAIDPLESLIKDVTSLAEQPHLQLSMVEETLRSHFPNLLEKYYSDMSLKQNARQIKKLKPKLLSSIRKIAENNTETWGDILIKALELDKSFIENRSKYDRKMYRTVFVQNSYAQYNPTDISTAYSIRELVDYIKNTLTIIPVSLKKYPISKTQVRPSTKLSVSEQFTRLQHQGKATSLDKFLLILSLRQEIGEQSLDELAEAYEKSDTFNIKGHVTLKKKLLNIYNASKDSQFDNTPIELQYAALYQSGSINLLDKLLMQLYHREEFDGKKLDSLAAAYNQGCTFNIKGSEKLKAELYERYKNYTPLPTVERFSSAIEQEYNRLLRETNERYPLDEQLVKYSKNKSSLNINLLKELIRDGNNYELNGFLELKKEFTQKIIRHFRDSSMDNKYLRHIDRVNRTAQNLAIRKLRALLLRGKCVIKNSDYKRKLPK